MKGKTSGFLNLIAISFLMIGCGSQIGVDSTSADGLNSTDPYEAKGGNRGKRTPTPTPTTTPTPTPVATVPSIPIQPCSTAPLFSPSFSKVAYVADPNADAGSLPSKALVTVGQTGIHKSIDDGVTFSSKFSGSNLLGVSFSDAMNGMAGGGGQVFGGSPYIVRTTNGGDSWTSSLFRLQSGCVPTAVSGQLQCLNYFPIFAIECVKRNEGSVNVEVCLAAGGAAGAANDIARWKSNDPVWRLVYAETPGTFYSIRSVKFSPDLTTVLAVNDSGDLFVSPDAGLRWSKQSSLFFTSLYGVAFASPSFAVAVGVYEGIVGLTRSADGLSWNPSILHSRYGDYLYSVAFEKAGPVGLIGGSRGHIEMTSNGGAAWQKISYTTTGEFIDSLHGVAFSNKRKPSDNSLQGVLVGAGGRVIRVDVDSANQLRSLKRGNCQP